MKTFFVDGSHWKTINNYTEFFSGTGGVIWKATEGTGFVDDTYASTKQKCIDHSEPFMPFHYFHPTLNPERQASHFVSTVGAGNFKYVCDIETTTLGMVYGVARSDDYRGCQILPMVRNYASIQASLSGTIIENTKVFLDECERLTGLKPIIYTSPGFWNAFMRPVPEWTSDYDLWVAHYTLYSEPTIPNGWTRDRCTMWQFTDKQAMPGTSDLFDGNWFYGSSEELVTYFRNGSATNPEPPPAPEFPRAVVIEDGLRVRSEPNTTSTVWFKMSAGTVVEALEKINKPNGDIWVRIGQRQYSAMLYTLNGEQVEYMRDL